MLQTQADSPGMSGILAGSLIYGEGLRKRAEGICIDNFVLLYLLKGNGRYIDFLGREFKLGPGDLAIRPPHLVHTIYRDPRETWLEFAMNIPVDIYQALKTCGFVDESRTFAMPGLSSIRMAAIHDFIDTLEEARSAAEGGTPLAKGLALLFDLIGSRFAAMPAEGNDATERKSMERAALLLRRDFGRKLDARSVAREIGLGYESFRKKFHVYAGVPPAAYRIGERIRKAKALLRDLSTTAKSIAVELGYGSLPEFSKQFKKETGLSPAKYRMALQSGRTDSGLCKDAR